MTDRIREDAVLIPSSADYLYLTRLDQYLDPDNVLFWGWEEIQNAGPLSEIESTIITIRQGLSSKYQRIPTLRHLEREFKLKRGEAGKLERSALRKLGLDKDPYEDPIIPPATTSDLLDE